MALSTKAARPKKAAKKSEIAAAEASAASNTTAPATRIGELPKDWREKPHNRRSNAEWNEDEGRRPTIKIHRPHQERNPERDEDDRKLGSGAALSA